MPMRGDMRSRIAFTCRFLFIAVCCAICAAAASGLLLSSVSAQTSVIDEMKKRAQDQDTRIFHQETSVLLALQRLAVLESDGQRRDMLIDDMRSQISTMHGGALAVGGILGVLMFLQMFFSRKRQGS